MEKYRTALQSVNKTKLAAATGLSYDKVKRFANGTIATLTKDEIEKIGDYFLKLALIFKGE